MPYHPEFRPTGSPLAVGFLTGSGEMMERVRAFDWSASPLGTPDTWPQSLRTTLSLVLHARQPMFLAWGENLTFLYNDAYALVLGAKHPHALARPFAVVWSDIWPQFGPFVERVIAGEALAFDDLPIPMMRNGYLEDTWFSFSYTPVHDENGRVAGLFCACLETTDKLRAEQDLRANEAQLVLERARLDALFRLLPVGVNFTDADGRTLLCNPAYRTYMPDGLIPSKAGAQAARWIAYDEGGRRLPPGQFPSARALRGEDGVQRDFLYQTPSGPARWTRVAAVPLRDQADQVTGALATLVDIDPERRAQEALRRLNETLEQRVEEALAERNLWADIFSTSDAFIMVVDFGYQILALNQAAANEFREIYGVRLHVGDNILDRLVRQPEQRSALEALWAPALAGEEFTIVQACGSPSHRQRHYEIRFSTLRDRNRDRIGAFSYASDVTERVQNQIRLAQAEEQLRQSQKMEAVGQLTGGIAHDFNNLLTGITGSLELLQRRIEQGRTADIERYVTTATTAAGRATALTHRLLAFSRRQPLDPKPVDANQLIASLEELLRRTIGETIELELLLAAGLWVTLCDPNQLENALLNLAINARDAMPDGGRLTIETRNAGIDADNLVGSTGTSTGDYISIRVADTGCGMPPDVIERAFEPFFTTKPLGQGTGLGLSMIYGFIRQSEGRAQIQSTPGRGTAVTLHLPRYSGDERRSDEERSDSVEGGRARGGETVLVVEDEPTVRALVLEVVSELGCRVIEAEDGPAGLRALKVDQDIDLLITDVGLPGLNGRQLADAARIVRPGLKILFMTGYAENNVIGSGVLEQGMAMVVKPFSIESLANCVRQMIEPRGFA